MSAILMNDGTMTEIADAIREKDGSTAQMLPSEMAGRIVQIQSGFYVYTPKSVTEKTSISKGTKFSGPGVFCINTRSNITKDAYIIVDGVQNNIGENYSPIEGIKYYLGYCIPFENELQVGDGFGDVSVFITSFNTVTKTKVETSIPKEIINLYPDTSTLYTLSLKGKGFIMAITDDTSGYTTNITIDGNFKHTGYRGESFASYFTKSIELQVSYTNCTIVLYDK